MRVTQQDIARIAQVSQSTVSRVLAGDEKVEPTLRDRVVAAIQAHNYRPDVRARSLRSSRTGLIGLVLHRPQGGLANDPFFARLTSEILNYLSGTPYHLCLDMVTSGSCENAVYDEMLRTRRVDGLVLVESEARDQRLELLQVDEFPFVLIGNPLASEDIHSFDNDNVLAGEVATRHLMEAGYRRIGILGGRRGVTVSDDRIAGYQRAIRATQDEHLVYHADFGLDRARDAAIGILAAQNRPDALVVLDDFMAMGVVLAARDRNLRIPEDLALVSFNDSHLCQVLEGGLTSVSLNIDVLVRRACDRLLGILEGEELDGDRREIIPCELRVRGSSRPREVSR